MKKTKAEIIKLSELIIKDNIIEIAITTKDNLTLNDVKNNLKYDVAYEDDKFHVDITKNDIFSFQDTEQELFRKMRKYIKTQQYEKAIILKKYFDTIELLY